MEKNRDEANALRVQKHMQDQTQKKLTEIENGVDELQTSVDDNISRLQAMMSGLRGETSNPANGDLEAAANLLSDSPDYESNREEIEQLDVIEPSDNWESYLSEVEVYAKKHQLNLTEDPFTHILTESQRIQIEKRIDEDFTFKNAQCDKYDYMLAAGCGSIAGLVDIIFVGAPGEGALSKAADNAVDKSVERFAKICGWKGPRNDSDSTKSAIGFLEQKFRINYDHTSSNSPNLKKGTNGQVKNLWTKNHHVRSLGHSPDIVGLFFSIYNQFTSTSSFIDGGKVITIDSETFDLQGTTFASKVFAGFCNWLGHLFSDVAGSSGADTRGAGIPMPFFSLLQFVQVGEFGQHKQSFATISVKVFEKGYDLRHGLAMAIPVLLSEVMTRLCWTLKQRFYHKVEWSKCLPSGSVPEVRRMLLVSHGVLCLVDGADAGLRSGGELVTFFTRANIIAWVRFGHVGIKEIKALWSTGKLDIEVVDDHLDQEYEVLLASGL